MVQPARIFRLWERLYNRFLIEPFPATGEGPAVSTTITPVTDADELLREYRQVEANTGDIDSSTSVTGLVVAEGERWRVHMFNASQSSGDRTLGGIGLTSLHVLNGLKIIDLASVTEVFQILANELVLEQGDSINVITDGGSTTTVYRVQAWISVEAAF